jgi:flagellar basal body-associated protein FliL
MWLTSCVCVCVFALRACVTRRQIKVYLGVSLWLLLLLLLLLLTTTTMTATMVMGEEATLSLKCLPATGRLLMTPRKATEKGAASAPEDAKGPTLAAGVVIHRAAATGLMSRATAG